MPLTATIMHSFGEEDWDNCILRKGFDSLAMLAQEVLKQNPFAGHLFAFRGRRGDLVKILYWDGQAFACLPSG